MFVQKRKKESNSSHIKRIIRRHIALTIIATSLFSIGLYLFIKYEERPVVETLKSEVVHIPPDVKKKIQYASPSATFRVPVLLYHYVEYVRDKGDTTRQSLDIEPYAFDAQVKTLKDAGYTFMTAKDLGDVLDGKRELPPKPVVLTFDDGYWDFYTDVLPILKKYNARATAYVVSGFIGNANSMSSQQLQGVIDSGLVDIGAHTVHHASLKGVLPSVVHDEVFNSKKMLEDTYHIKVVSFAYPNGSFDNQAIQEVKDAGFTTAVSTLPGEDVNQTNRFFIYRLRPGYRTGQDLINYLNSNPWTPPLSGKIQKP